MKRINFIIMFLCCAYSQDIYVDRNMDYEKQYYAKFDRFTKHGGFNNYENSSKDEIQLPNDFPSLGNTFTLEALYYSNDSTSDYHQKIIGNLIFTGNQYGNSSPHITFIRNDDIYYGFSSDGQIRNKIKAGVRDAKRWQHVAFSFDGTKAKLYLDGIAIDSTSNWAGLMPSDIPITSIGTRFSGKLDEVRIWDIARSAVEINQNMLGSVDENSDGLLAYYKMDTDEDFKIIDHTSNQYHALINDVEILPQYLSSEFCPNGPDGSLGCPYPTILSALENTQGGQTIFVKEGRYTDLIFADYINQSTYQEGPIIELIGENENTLIDGTVEVNASWELHTLNGNQVYKATLDMGQISKKANTYIDTIYGVFVNDRYMIPAMPVNFKNPTDPTDGNKDNPELNTVFSVDHGGAPYAGGYEPGDLNNLDNPEEYGFDNNTNTLYIYPGNEIPDSTNVRVRVRTYSLYLHNSDNITFNNFHFYSGAVFTRDASYITFKNSRFSHSWEVGLRYRQMLAAGIDNRHKGNMMVNGLHNTVRNCIFKYVVDAYIFRTRSVRWPVYENILAEYNGWFGSEYWNLKVDDNCVNCNADITNDDNYFPDSWRYITMRQNRSGNIGPGKRSLVEYAWIENHYQDTDGSGIGRASGAANKSTTRYCWLFNTNRNGLRFDGNCAGQFGLVHHVVSIGNKRGFRIKGDKHNIYHIAAYDNYDNDIVLRADKYCGDYGSEDFVDGVENGQGNYNTDVHNVISGRSFGCASSDCGDQEITNNGEDVVNTDPEFLLNESGNWYGRHFPIDNNEGNWSQSFPQLEMENPWLDNRNRSSQQLMNIFGADPFEDDRIQSYDFRPKKGSIFIDGGKIIEGINDGQDEDFYHAPTFANQNRAFVGDAPDIGPYEYGDSVYWIPGYRYNYPSIPIPSNGATNVPLEYGIAWNYPWSENYDGVTATVTINGPGLSQTNTFAYPLNVMFVNLRPASYYTWSVHVNGIAGTTNSGNWTFTTADKLFPQNDRSIDVTIPDSIYLPQQIQTLTVSKDYKSFLKFDIPSFINDLSITKLSLIPETVHTLIGGLVLYKYDNTEWGERIDDNNIGLADHSMIEPIDTIFSVVENVPIEFNITDYVNDGGMYSFSLGVLDTNDHISFYSSERLVLKGEFNSTVENHNSGYATLKSVWPHLSFQLQDASYPPTEFNLISPDDSSHIVITPENIDQETQIEIIWDSSIDPDGNDIVYKFLLFNGSQLDNETVLFDTTTSDTAIFLDYQIFIDTMGDSNQDFLDRNWTIFASDGEDSTMGNEIRNIQFDLSNILDIKTKLIPDKYFLHQNYPNPFNPRTIIRYDLPKDSNVNIRIFNIMGREVMSLKNNMQKAGYKSIEWNATNNQGQPVSAGGYTYSIEVGNFIQTKKMVLLK